MNKAEERYYQQVQQAMQAERGPTGWAILIFGTVRWAYVTPDLQTTYNECEAAVYDSKAEASQVMNGFYDSDRFLWQHMRLLPLKTDKPIGFDG